MAWGKNDLIPPFPPSAVIMIITLLLVAFGAAIGRL